MEPETLNIDILASVSRQFGCAVMRVVWRGVAWCGMVCGDVLRCGVVRCGVVRRVVRAW